MYKSIKDLYFLLTNLQRKKLIKLQFLVILMSLFEVASVLSIGPFMGLVADISLLEKGGLISELYQLSGMSDSTSFLFLLGVVVLLVLLLSSVTSMFTVWRLSMYGSQIGADLGNRLYRYYVYQGWLFHTTNSSSMLTKKIAQETGRVTNQIISPLMQLNAKIVLSLFMASTVFIINPMVSIVGVVVFLSAYVLLYKVVRVKLVRNGSNISSAQTDRYKLMSEGFGGIKDVLLLGRQSVFISRFVGASDLFAYSQANNSILQQVPRYAMELIAFSSVIFLILYLLVVQQGDLAKILPVLAIYALAGFKMLPAFQHIYANVTKLRGNLAGFEAIQDDLRATQGERFLCSSSSEVKEKLILRNTLQLNEINFHYPGKKEPALNALSLSITVNKVVGFVGASGSGKSTAIDLLLGLIEPDNGSVLLDGEPMINDIKRSWQNNVGFVPQSIFLADSSIRENIAFGLPNDLIDDEKIWRAASMAQLSELLNGLPEGIETLVGERGVQLSGGQRQRIGIARALYNDADVLILDEATSALDGVTEKLIMNAIHEFSGKKTIIMIAHRLSTVKQCDEIFFMDKGRVVDHGEYSELIKRNVLFKTMADHA